MENSSKDDVLFVYDGDCPVCSYAAKVIKIRRAAGSLHLINAREDTDNPVLNEINNRRINLDDGMVVKYHKNFYHGSDALHIIALLGTNSDWLNRLNARLFKSRYLSRLLYPPLRGIRNLLLRIKGVEKIRNLD